MRLEQLAQSAVSQLAGAMIRRAVVALVAAICAIVAVYHLTIAGMLALEMHYGVLDARLIIAAIYAVATLIAFGMLWQQIRQGRLNGHSKALTSPRELQLIMLVEAVMLGYELARKGVRSR